jgi:Glycosyl transferase family 2
MWKCINIVILFYKMTQLSVNIIYNTVNTLGLKEDVQVIERIVQAIRERIYPNVLKRFNVCDIRQPLQHADINIHLEIPVYSAIPWAHSNILIVNPEQWSSAYDSYVESFDAVIFKDEQSAADMRQYYESRNIVADNIYYVPWTCFLSVEEYVADKKKYVQNAKKTNDRLLNLLPMLEENGSGSSGNNVYGTDTRDRLGFLCLLGGSTNKYEYMKEFIRYWKPEYPSIHIFTTRDDYHAGLKNVCVEMGSQNIYVKCRDMNLEDRRLLQSTFKGHVLCSRAEGFALGGAVSEVMGVYTIMNSLSVFKNTFGGGEGEGSIGWLTADNWTDSGNELLRVRYAVPPQKDSADISNRYQEELDRIVADFKTADVVSIEQQRQQSAQKRFQKACDAFENILKTIAQFSIERRPRSGNVHCPPILHAADCPPISIICLTHNRRNLIDIALHNLLTTDYPRNKMEVIFVEDSTNQDLASSDKIISFQVNVPDIKIKYIPLAEKTSIGQKRNIGIENAGNDIILFMDDDDHYPETSFRRRVAWLTRGVRRGAVTSKCVGTTTIAMYDLQRGISAVNVPPFELPLGQRISEATLAFYKSFWEEKKFEGVNVAEGEKWLEGRERDFLEIAPQQIIVAFSHNQNTSSRRIPESESPPGCAWGFPEEYLRFIHRTQGIEIEDSGGSSTTSSPSNKNKARGRK